MKTKRKQRLIFVVILLLGVGSATALALYAFNQNLLYFYSPTQVFNKEVQNDVVFRLGGLVVADSVRKSEDGVSTSFELTDTKHAISVHYTGLLPDLFREGQGIVTQGKLNADGVFIAQEVLAKHDENYMPPDVADALKEAGGSHPIAVPRNKIYPPKS